MNEPLEAPEAVARVEEEFDFTCSECRKMERGTYSLAVRCSNCGTEGIGVFSKSHDALSAECPVCETRNMRPVRG